MLILCKRYYISFWRKLSAQRKTWNLAILKTKKEHSRPNHSSGGRTTVFSQQFQLVQLVTLSRLIMASCHRWIINLHTITTLSRILQCLENSFSHSPALVPGQFEQTSIHTGCCKPPSQACMSPGDQWTRDMMNSEGGFKQCRSLAIFQNSSDTPVYQSIFLNTKRHEYHQQT